MMNKIRIIVIGILTFTVTSCEQKISKTNSLSDTMDGILTRFYSEFTPEELNKAKPEFILNNILPEERKAFTSKYWYFDVNVPVTVSLMRHVGQKMMPFWIEETGFKKTDLKVTNEEYTYEVWRKEFPAGKVELGISGFENHRTPYFVSVGKADKSNTEELKITNIFPATQDQQAMEKGSHVYTCWRLEVQEFPEELAGDILLSSYRGRPRESHILGALRETEFPSSAKPDQIALTWSGDTKTSVDVQWRTSLDIKSGLVKYWKAGNTDTITISSSVKELYDRSIYNESRVNRHTVQISSLEPGTTYKYLVESDGNNSETETFNTASEDDKFSFIWFGDTHHSKQWANLLKQAESKHPEVAFYSIAGDLVDSGLYRDEWDDIFGFTGDVFSRKPLMSVPGNHDNQDGLGNQLYYELLSFPMNGPEGVDKECTYSFEYKNALFLMIDATQELDSITPWIEEQLKSSDATWKFAMFHFPPYNWEEPYYDIQEKWCPIFDKYHVDMVMSGHIHYYMRSKPMFNGEVVDSFNNGTAYVISTGLPSNHDKMTDEPYAAIRDTKSQYYQKIDINGGRFKFSCVNGDGIEIDSFEINKEI
ncbi:purple acid phosphatase family protein [Chondrinema litorale]|uniref:purple acid phosphatase family protein n=1 Tax=Chondrinema litorale TaxID=2994555 RepID=UPI002543AB6F|nr:metallophosphoesterase family protein [Chondrinema litorale]UZR97196.1 metallophosphoesterase family protein [Chondrinema litorale]